ncbi:MAG: hypothetical protein AB2809_18370 [Candidatus Thiodiazotropha sp.]
MKLILTSLAVMAWSTQSSMAAVPTTGVSTCGSGGRTILGVHPAERAAANASDNGVDGNLIESPSDGGVPSPRVAY